MSFMRSCITAAVVLASAFHLVASLSAAEPVDTRRGDAMLSNYFQLQTDQLEGECLADINTLDEWKSKRDGYREQLYEMLGLSPLPERTDLKATITGVAESDGVVVERIHFQSRPGLYVTGNLYRPAKVDKPLPAILYVCGHGRVVIDGKAYGNKVHYQHHGAWFARNGYVCLTIDTVQLGEIEGVHHGTYSKGRWWWYSRGYTPAGVEAWNCIRALDYLQSRKEVDGERLGVTGRSGGGAYSWWIAAIDERIRCAVPVAGITDLQNHVVDGCVEGHCDCMYMVNTYRWDYSKVAALVAPRPLLISNTDRDRIFPLDGVVRVYNGARRIYGLYGNPEDIAVHITAGPHKDTQELRIHAFRWFNHYLKDDDALITDAADRRFEPAELKVFEELPDDSTNEHIDESFVATAEPANPENADAWKKQTQIWRTALQEKVFRGWPADKQPIDLEEAFTADSQGVSLSAYDFTSQEGVRLRLYLAHRTGLTDFDLVVLNTLDDSGWEQFLKTYRPGFEKQLQDEHLPPADPEAFADEQKMFRSFKWAMAYVAPRGVGPTAFNQSARKQIQNRRRFYLLGQTLDGMQTYDTVRAAEALRSIASMKKTPLWMQAHGPTAGATVYASLFIPNVTRLDLHELPASHRVGPTYLNVQRYLDLPQAIAMAAERTRVVIYGDKKDWSYPLDIVKNLEWDAKALQIRNPVKE